MSLQYSIDYDFKKGEVCYSYSFPWIRAIAVHIQNLIRTLHAVHVQDLICAYTTVLIRTFIVHVQDLIRTFAVQ